MRVFLTKEQAKSVLAESNHAFVASRVPPLLGLDLNKVEAHQLIDNSFAIELTGDRARAMGHGIMVFDKDGTARGLRTNEEKLAAIEKALIDEDRTIEAAPQWWKEGKECPYK